MDLVLHLAALIAIPYSYIAPFSFIATNVIGTHNVLEAARHHGVSRMVHASTSEVYGTPDTLPITEKHPLKGQSPYLSLIHILAERAPVRDDGGADLSRPRGRHPAPSAVAHGPDRGVGRLDGLPGHPDGDRAVRGLRGHAACRAAWRGEASAALPRRRRRGDPYHLGSARIV